MRSQRRLSKTITAAKLCQGHPPAKKKVQICFQALAALKDHDIVYFSFAPWRASVSFYCMPRHGNVPLQMGIPLKEAC